jgi:hypothetical protein
MPSGATIRGAYGSASSITALRDTDEPIVT